MNINIVLDIILILIGLYLSLFKSYFNEKGKNIATKEDIREITEIVEEVKKDFTIESEKLRSELSLFNIVFIGLVAEERNAIVDYNEKYFLWLHTLTDLQLGYANITDNNELEEHKKKIERYWHDYINSKARFQLFVEDLEFILLITKMEGETLNLFVQLKSDYIYSLQKINRERLIAYNQNDQIKIDQLLVDMREYSRKFNEDILMKMPIITKVNSEFHKRCRAHLYQLIGNKKV